MAGIVFARLTPNAQLATKSAFIAIAICALFLLWKRTRLLAAAASLLLLGAALYNARYSIAPNDLRTILTGEPEIVTIRGQLLETPEVREFDSSKGEIAYSYSTLQVTALQKNKSDWQPAAGRINTRLRGELTTDFFRGRTAEITGVIAFPPRAPAPGLFDYRAYLHHTRIFHQLKNDTTNDWRLISFEPMPITEQFRRWAARQLQRGIPANDEATETIAAMTLGLRNSMSGEMTDVFMKTGTLHIVAISGLHVACIAMFFSLLMRAVGLPRSAQGIIIIALVWFYTAATGLQSSACRSAVMATVFMLQWVVRRPAELVNSVAASAALILLIQPEQLFQASFQLSFSVVLVIALAATFTERYYPSARVQLQHQLLRVDPLLPYDLLPRWKKTANVALGLLIGNFFVSTASWIGSMPLTAYYFNTVTPISLLANLIAVPLSSASLAFTVISILLPWFAPATNYLAWLAMKATIWSVESFGSFSFGYFYVPSPNALFLIAYSLLIAVVLIPPLRLGLRKFASASIIAVLSLFWLGSLYAAKPLATITILPCAGAPTLVEEPRWRELLIDCSSERDADYMLKRFLRSRGRGSIDSLLITHGDAQVVGGFNLMWNQFSPEKVYTSATRMRSPNYRKAIDLLSQSENQSENRWQRIAAGDLIDQWTVLHPERNDGGFPRADDNAVVLRRTIAGCTILHLSELGPRGQQQLLERNNSSQNSPADSSLQADILIAGMPEQGEPLHPNLLQAIQPKIIILATAEYPYTAQPKPELRQRLESTGATLFYLHETRAITITLRPNETRVTSMDSKSVTLRRNVNN